MMNKDKKFPSNNVNGNNRTAVVTYVTSLNLSRAGTKIPCGVITVQILFFRIITKFRVRLTIFGTNSIQQKSILITIYFILCLTQNVDINLNTAFINQSV